jgi:hypothetical protein
MVFLGIRGVSTLSEDFYLHYARGSLRIIAITRPIEKTFHSEIENVERHVFEVPARRALKCLIG